MYTVVIPTLNEVGNIPVLLNRLPSDYSELIFCDNGSSDGTVELIQSIIQNHPKIKLSEGTGTVSNAIYRGIMEASYSSIVVLDSDLSHPPELVSKVASLLQQYDFVLGTRYQKGGKSKDSLVNKFFSIALNLVTYPLAPKFSDRGSGFWGIRKSLVKKTFRSFCKPALEAFVTCPVVSSTQFTYNFGCRQEGKSKLGRGKSVLITARDIVVLYCKKYSRFIKYSLVGGTGALLNLGLLAFFTQVCHIWYIYSALLSTLVAFLFNYYFNRMWTFSSSSSSRLDSDYEYKSWYQGNLIQKKWKRSIASWTLSVVENSKSIIEVGCGSSPLLGMLPGKVIGIDRDGGKLAYQRTRCNGNVSLIQCNLGIDGYPQLPKVDSIICNNLLEHLTNPEDIIKWISSLVVEEGKVVLTVPNYSIKYTDWMEKLYGRLMPKSYAEDHYYQFTEETLDSICKDCGLFLVSRHKVFTDMVCLYKKN